MATQAVRALDIAVGPMFQWESLEGSAQTYKAGAVLVYSSGLLIESSANPQKIVGLASRDGQNKTGTNNLKKTQFRPILPGTIVEGNIVGSATEVVYVLRGSAVGLVCGVIKRTAESATPWAINANTVTAANACVRIIGLKDASGDVNGRVYAVVLATKSAWLC